MKKPCSVFLQLLPAILSLLLMAAHLLRANHPFLTIGCLLFPFILLGRGPASARIVQGALFLATLEWVRTLYVFVSIRMETGQPWIRLAIILGCVASFTLVSGLAFFSKTLKERYKLAASE